MFPNGTAVEKATEWGARGSRALYNLFWQLRGGECSVRTDFGFQGPAAAGAGPSELAQSMACDLGLEGGELLKVSSPLLLCHAWEEEPSQVCAEER